MIHGHWTLILFADRSSGDPVLDSKPSRGTGPLLRSSGPVRLVAPTGPPADDRHRLGTSNPRPANEAKGPGPTRRRVPTSVSQNPFLHRWDRYEKTTCIQFYSMFQCCWHDPFFACLSRFRPSSLTVIPHLFLPGVFPFPPKPTVPRLEVSSVAGTNLGNGVLFGCGSGCLI